MEAKAGGRDRISLVVEPKSAAVIVAGKRVALPAKQFALMRALAADPGSALEASDLIAKVWEGRPGMTSSDLHALVWRLRRRIGDTGPEPQIIVNRKGLGYLIDTEAVDVTVMGRPGATPDPRSAPGGDVAAAVSHHEAGTPDQDPVDEESGALVGAAQLDESVTRATRARSPREEGAVDPLAAVGVVAASSAQKPGPREVGARRETQRGRLDFRGKSLRWWTAAAGAVVFFGFVGFLGGLIASEPPAADDRPIAAEPKPSASPQARADRGEQPRDDERRRSPRPSRNRSPGGGSGASGAAVAAAPPVAATAPHTAPPATSAPRQHGPPPKRQPVALPPPPTRYLYHLYNAANGDHFVTTDGAAVTEHEAKGYEGGAIARVYVAPEKATKAIALNYGSAFIFIDPAPKTDPASATVPLWLAKNNAGDFFYSTSGSEASQGEWSASVIGYVRTL